MNEESSNKFTKKRKLSGIKEFEKIETKSLLSNSQQSSSFLSALVSVLVVIGSALICFAAARNSITWHFQRFWGASGDFWQAQWDRVLDNVGEDPFFLWTSGLGIISFVVYWSFGGLFTLLDIVNKPQALMRYKMQPGTNEPVETKKLINAIFWVLINQFIATAPLGLLFYDAMCWRGLQPIRKLPTFHWVLFELACLIMMEEIGFYYSHRLLHNRYLYKTIHKKHHEWTAPIAITAMYCHPIENILGNVFPIFLGMFIMGSHVATAYLWSTIAIVSTLLSHCGYHFPFIPSTEFHDFHHLKFNSCFGVLGILDRLHGTDTAFRASRAYDRHVIMFNLTPLWEIYPDLKSSNDKLGK